MHLTSMICNLTALVQGSWHLFNHSMVTESVIDPWIHCPRTLASVLAPPPDDFPLNGLTKHVERYTCYNRTFRLARYNPHGCHIESLHSSVTDIADHIQRHKVHATPSKSTPSTPSANNSTKSPTQVNNTGNKDVVRNRVVYVGDSLMGQIYIATQCTLEEHNILAYRNLNFSYHGDFFLRPDIPCDPKCIGNPKMWNVTEENVPFPPCFACSHGIHHPFEIYIYDRIFSWVVNIPDDTLAIVISSGAWYNIYKGLLDPIASFEDTLIRLKPYFEEFMTQRGIEVIWLGLPPMNTAEMEVMGGVKFGWDQFWTKDNLVKQHYSTIGVHFIDMRSLLAYRKLHDPSVKSDALHWCNPGISSVPAFVVKVIFHVLVTALKAKTPSTQ